jgi:decaprenyl-phosphate phosphoribosyltransferase
MSFNESNPLKRIKSKFSAYIRELRVRQWTKNLIIFAAPLFDFNLNISSLSGSFIAFSLFCCASSSFYLINDIIDVEADRLHPVKCKRPIAAGEIGISEAITVAIILFSVAAIAGYRTSFGLGTAIVGYALLQVAYNLKLKHKIFVDVLAISAGFVLRAWGGATAAGVELSHWFILCTAMLALFLGIEKRKAELRLSEIKGRKSRAVLHRYSLPLLNRMESIVTNGTIVFYTLWSAGPAFKGAATSWMMLTVPFVLYGIFRYQLLSDPQEIARSNPQLEQGGKTERPEEMLLSDKLLSLTAIGWIITVFTIQLLYKLQWIH